MGPSAAVSLVLFFRLGSSNVGVKMRSAWPVVEKDDSSQDLLAALPIANAARIDYHPSFLKPLHDGGDKVIFKKKDDL